MPTAERLSLLGPMAARMKVLAAVSLALLTPALVLAVAPPAQAAPVCAFTATWHSGAEACLGSYGQWDICGPLYPYGIGCSSTHVATCTIQTTTPVATCTLL